MVPAADRWCVRVEKGGVLGLVRGGEPKPLQSIPTVILAGYLGAVVGGILTGVLRRQVPRAGWWVLASTVPPLNEPLCNPPTPSHW